MRHYSLWCSLIGFQDNLLAIHVLKVTCDYYSRMYAKLSRRPQARDCQSPNRTNKCSFKFLTLDLSIPTTNMQREKWTRLEFYMNKLILKLILIQYDILIICFMKWWRMKDDRQWIHGILLTLLISLNLRKLLIIIRI